MKPNNTALERLRQATPEAVRISEIAVDDAFQSRAAVAVPYKARAAVERESHEHVDSMKKTLAHTNTSELEPVLLAQVDGKQYLVDGFHRLSAYRRAGRLYIPARTASMSRQEAVMVSKLANMGPVQLSPHKQQRMELAWQYFILSTDNGLVPKDQWPSVRDIAAMFNVGSSSIGNMRPHIAEHVRASEYRSEALDPATGYPLWKYVRSPKGQAAWDDLPLSVLADRRIEKALTGIGKHMGTLQDATERRALIERLRNEAGTLNDDLADALEVAEGLAGGDF